MTKYFLIGILFFPVFIKAQIVNKQELKLKYDSISQLIKIEQKIILNNNISYDIDTLTLINWANAYHSKKTALAQRFIENYDFSFHFTSLKNRGYVQIDTVYLNHHKITNLRTDDEFYFLKLPKDVLNTRIDTLTINYTIKLPHQKFTNYGIDKAGNILLENFYFYPVLNHKRLYRNKNIDDYQAEPVMFNIELTGFDSGRKVYSNLIFKNHKWKGKLAHPVFVITNLAYEHYQVDSLEVVFPVRYKNIDKFKKAFILNKIISFLENHTGGFPYRKILITHKDFNDHKVYGPDLLPNLLNPFEDSLLWETKILHQLSIKYTDVLQIDKRKNPWLTQGMFAYLEYLYFQINYPDLKLFGKLSDTFILKYYYASQVKMSEKYPWLYLYMARMNKDQALQTSLDSLSNFNRNVANPFKAALGLVMLNDQLGDSLFSVKFKEFYQYGLQQEIGETDFYKHFDITQKAKWFIPYIKTRKKYDYKTLSFKQVNDSSYQIKLRNNRKTLLPATLYLLSDDTILNKKKLPLFYNDTTIEIVSKKKLTYAGINYFNNYPEYQTNNNYRKLNKKLFSLPLQMRLYEDFDNPLKKQFFTNPFFEYNYYDGVILGLQFYNSSVLHNHLNWYISPSFSTKDRSITGSFSFNNSHFFDDYKPYALHYGFNYKYYHYDHNLAYKRLNSYFVVKFRNKYIRKRQGNNLKLQYMHIDKDELQKTEEGNYWVFNLNYSGFNKNVINDFFYKADFQLSEKFAKTSLMLRYRFMSDSNRQWDFRVFAGYFLFNHTQTDYFSFALDRPTDYLFQYNYYGRSETSGIFHQQFVWAEGGFKTFYPHQFANEFIFSNNLNIGIWKWFNIYTDWAWKKNRGEDIGFYYGSGIRINLVQDYFEFFFPMYSNLGWEVKQPDYWKRIRFVFTIDSNRLFKMIRRGWY